MIVANHKLDTIPYYITIFMPLRLVTQSDLLRFTQREAQRSSSSTVRLMRLLKARHTRPQKIVASRLQVTSRNATFSYRSYMICGI